MKHLQISRTCTVIHQAGLVVTDACPQYSVSALLELGTAKTFYCDESQGSNCVANSQTHSRTDKQHTCNIKVQPSSIDSAL